VYKVFVGQPSYQGGGNSYPPKPLGPPCYFRLPMVHPGTPPLPPNRLYHWPFNYLEYVKDSNLDVHVRIFKAAIRTNSKTNDVEIVNLFSFTISDIVFN
jgi:hypothetical protein